MSERTECVNIHHLPHNIFGTCCKQYFSWSNAIITSIHPRTSHECWSKLNSIKLIDRTMKLKMLWFIQRFTFSCCVFLSQKRNILHFQFCKSFHLLFAAVSKESPPRCTNIYRSNEWQDLWFYCGCLMEFQFTIFYFYFKFQSRCLSFAISLLQVICSRSAQLDRLRRCVTIFQSWRKRNCITYKPFLRIHRFSTHDIYNL